MREEGVREGGPVGVVGEGVVAVPAAVVRGASVRPLS